jgi:hypothetical protein
VDAVVICYHDMHTSDPVTEEVQAGLLWQKTAWKSR